jgi:hypothetical protein
MADYDHALTQWGREPEFVPPKPPSARTIARLAGELERAEQEHDQLLRVIAICGPNWAQSLDPDEIAEVNAEELGIHCRYWDAEIAYSRANAARDLVARVRAEDRKTPPRAADAFKLRDAKYEALARLDLIKQCRPEFATTRELLDANAAAVLAAELYEIAERKFQDAERQARADRSAGIVRYGALRITRR